MAPEITVVTSVDVAADVQAAEAWEAGLVRKAAASLVQPHKSSKQVVEDLLARLQNIRRRRDLRGLNHWDEFAPTYLQRMLVRHEALRRRAVEEFFRTERVHALARAEAILGDRSDAEDAVSDAYIKLLTGKTGPSHFYRLLSQVCIWRKRARRSAAKLFTQELPSEFEGEGTAYANPACAILSQGDPLEILLHEEAIQEAIRDVKTKREHRDVRRLDWWNDLMEHYCPEEVEGKQPAQAHI